MDEQPITITITEPFLALVDEDALRAAVQRTLRLEG